MSSTRQLFRQPTDWFLASPLAAYVDAFTRYLSERRHASKTIRKYLSCLAHLGRWMSQCQLDIECIDEGLVRRILHDHLPRCDCAWPVRRNRVDRFSELSGAAAERTVELHLAYHTDHRPRRGPLSTCMHRPEARTVSFSRVTVDAEQVAFWYAPHPPCRGIPEQPAVTLERRDA